MKTKIKSKKGVNNIARQKKSRDKARMKTRKEARYQVMSIAINK